MLISEEDSKFSMGISWRCQGACISFEFCVAEVVMTIPHSNAKDFFTY